MEWRMYGPGTTETVSSFELRLGTVCRYARRMITFVFNCCSSILQIPGESTLRRNFQQIQEGEGRRTPNPFYMPPAPPKGANHHRVNHLTDQSSVTDFENSDFEEEEEADEEDDDDDDLPLHPPYHHDLSRHPLPPPPPHDLSRHPLPPPPPPHNEPQRSAVRHLSAPQDRLPPDRHHDVIRQPTNQPQAQSKHSHHNHHMLPPAEPVVGPLPQQGRLIGERSWIVSENS